jgi:hypothetical protein
MSAREGWTLITELRWQAEREQIREILGAPAEADLGRAANDIRLAFAALEAENARLRALMSTARYLASEAVHGTLTAERPVQDAEGVTAQAFEDRAALGDLLACAACRAHLVANPMAVDACASVAHDRGTPVVQVLSEYLWLQHRQHEPGGGDASWTKTPTASSSLPSGMARFARSTR